jgi:hypothetical protein
MIRVPLLLKEVLKKMLKNTIMYTKKYNFKYRESILFQSTLNTEKLLNITTDTTVYL